MDNSRHLCAFGMGPQLGDGMLLRSSVLQGMVYAATKSGGEESQRHKEREQQYGRETEFLKGRNAEFLRCSESQSEGRAGDGRRNNTYHPSSCGTTPSGESSRRVEDNFTGKKPEKKVNYGSRSGGFRCLGRPPRGLGHDKPRRVKSKVPAGQANLPRSSHEEDGGRGKSRASSRKALETAINNAAKSGWRKRVREEFTRKFFAGSTWASKSSKRKKMEMIANQCGYPIAPVSTDTLVEMAAILDDAKLQASDQYLAEAKWAHIEEGHKWDETLERKFAMCKRALKRDNGPEKRAQEVKLEDISSNTWAKVSDEKTEPRRIAWIFAWAVIWMLRSIEVVNVKTKHVQILWKERMIRLTIPKSKMDQAAKGQVRTLGCCGESQCRRSCAWSIGVGLMSEAPSEPEASLFPRNDGKCLSRIQLVLLWQKFLDARATGHSGRRSGAMMYARQGLPLFDIAFLGRWKSSAVMRYMTEALEQLPLNVRQQGNKQISSSSCEEKPAEVESQDKEVKFVKVIRTEEIRKSEVSKEAVVKPPNEKQKLWAISRNRQGRVRHWVSCASWSIPLEEWATACGWHFARHNVKVELTKFKVSGPRECRKCKLIEKERDKVKGGWDLAQTVEV